MADSSIPYVWHTATSGVLCIGLSRKAAACASILFERRQTRKEYVALIDGRLDLSGLPYREGQAAEEVREKREGGKARETCSDGDVYLCMYVGRTSSRNEDGWKEEDQGCPV